MTLKKDPENVSAGKGKMSIAKGICVFSCLALLFWAFWLTHKPGLSEPILECSPKEPAQQAAAQPEITPQAVAAPSPQPAPISLPSPLRFVIERISTYIVGDFISPSFGGHTVWQYVSVKYVGQDEARRYPVDEWWAIARAGDVVVFTPVMEKNALLWETSVEFARTVKK